MAFLCLWHVEESMAVGELAMQFPLQMAMFPLHYAMRPIMGMLLFVFWVINI